MNTAWTGLPKETRQVFQHCSDLERKLDMAFNMHVLRSLESAAARPGRLRVRLEEDPDAVRAWSIGQRIRARRESLGWTQKDLADNCGIARANVARLEASRHSPKIETVRRVARALGVRLAEMIESPSCTLSPEDSAWLESGVPEWGKSLEGEDERQ